MSSSFYLTLSCNNRPGIVAAVAACLYKAGGNIAGAQQFDDIGTGRFFMRVELSVVNNAITEAELRERFSPTGLEFGMQWSLRDRSRKPRVLIFVSTLDHCLSDLMYRFRIGELPMTLVGIVSNHPQSALNLSIVGDVPFYYLPITAGAKRDQETRVKNVIDETRTELVVLARYMQILSDDLSAYLSDRCINIHHSFLPGFKGARPYTQAFARGVKMIGATAHYVTADLDEGPIIIQDTEPVSHADTPDTLARKGRDIERRVLARAVLCHMEERVLLNGSKTVVFHD